MLRRAFDFVSPLQLETLVFARYASHFPGKYENLASEEFHSVFKSLAREGQISAFDNWNEIPHADTKSSLEILRKMISRVDTQGDLRAFPAIKANEDGLIVDGMKRMSIAISRGFEFVEVELVTGKSWSQQSQIIRTTSAVDGTSNNPDLDSLVLEYSKIKSDLRVMILFSGSKGFERKVEELTSQVGRVVLSKVFELTDTGLMRLIEIAYSTADWWWSSSLSKKIKKEKASGHKPPHQALLVVYQTQQTGSAKKGKLHVRAEMEKSGFRGSLHGSDYKQDTQPVLDVLLSGGGIHFLNHAVYGAEHKFISGMSRKLDSEGIMREDRVFTGPAILGVYGLRKNGLEEITSIPSVDSKCDELGLATFEYGHEQLFDIRQEKNTTRVGGLRFQSLWHFVNAQTPTSVNIAASRNHHLAASLLSNFRSFPLAKIRYPRLFFLHVRYSLKNQILFGGAAVVKLLPTPIFGILQKLPFRGAVKRVLKIN